MQALYELRVEHVHTIVFWVVVAESNYTGKVFYTGRRYGITWASELSKAKFYHRIGDAKHAISYHQFKDGAHLEHVFVEGELYVD